MGTEPKRQHEEQKITQAEEGGYGDGKLDSEAAYQDRTCICLGISAAA